MNRVYGALPFRLQRGLSALVFRALFGLVAVGLGANAWAAPARTVVVYGDSLSAGHGLASGEGWVDLTRNRMAAQAPGWKVVNASVTGETSAGGAARIAGVLARHKPSIVIVELGGNDGLRGLPAAQLRANLGLIVQRSQAAGARVLVVGMRMPPNFGRRYTQDFEAAFADTATKYRAAYLPFLLAPIATDPNAFQPDNIHPVAAVQPKLRDYVWTRLGPMLSAKPAPAKPARATRATGG